MDYSLISRHRTAVMGFAALMILLFHFGACLYDSLQIPVLTSVLSCGNIGVDIFLFLSGTGLYCSMTKDSRPLPFYRRRISRVLIPTLAVSLPYWLATDFLFKKTGAGMFLLDWTTLSFWTHGNRTVWYVSLLLVLYLLYPLIFRLQEKHAGFIVLIMVLCFAAVLGQFFLAREIYDKYEIASTRIPVFFAGSLTGGLLFGKQDQRLAKIVTGYAVLMLIPFISAFFLSSAEPDAAMMLYRIGCGGAGIFISMLLAKLLERFPNRAVSTGLNALGGISLELYLIHIFIKNLLSAMRIGQKSGAAVQIIIILAAMLLSVLLSLGVGRLIQRIRRGSAKPKTETASNAVR